ncbi:MAG TPA: pyridoxamine 5'-phosphate oxidase family protein [Candidatus Binataceae bacterium]|nr:pyridoxamine 5'-phosphate oxidase family protein [Candidatus Binataceae bacterium]
MADGDDRSTATEGAGIQASGEASAAPADPAALSSAGERALQARYGKGTHALAFYKHQVIDHLNDTMQAFIGRMEMVFLATAGSGGDCHASFRAGHPGFVKALDAQTLIYPEYRGNGVLSSLGNIFENPHVALMFVDFAGDQIGLHLNGRARILENDELIEFLRQHPNAEAVFKDAILSDIMNSDGGHLERWVMVSVTRAFVHCSKHIPPLARLDHDIQWGTETVHHVHGGDYFGIAHGQKT